MIVINLEDNKVKLVAEAPNWIIDIRTQRKYYEVICKKTQKKYFEEVVINEEEGE